MQLFSFWLGENAMSPARQSALASMANSGLKVEFLRQNDLGKWLGESDLHPAYWYLSDVHKSDYLRCYFMHHIGGGYADIKWINDSWLPEVRRLERSKRLIVSGYEELNPDHVSGNLNCQRLLSRPRWRKEAAYVVDRRLRRRYDRLIGNGAYLCKPGSAFTHIWWRMINRRLDKQLPALRARPACHPRDGAGLTIEGQPSTYPLPWVYLAGSIVHPLSYVFRHRISRDLPRLGFRSVEFENYF